MNDLTEQNKPTYYVPLSDYKEVKKMFLAANDEITKLKELLKECQGSIATLLSKSITEVNGIKQKELLTRINQALGEEK